MGWAASHRLLESGRTQPYLRALTPVPRMCSLSQENISQVKLHEILLALGPGEHRSFSSVPVSSGWVLPAAKMTGLILPSWVLRISWVLSKYCLNGRQMGLDTGMVLNSGKGFYGGEYGLYIESNGLG